MPESTAEPRLSDAAPALAGHLDHVRRRQCGVALRTGFAMALAAVLAWLAIEMPLDWLLALPFAARAVMLALGVGGATALAWRFGIRKWLHQPDDDHITLGVKFQEVVHAARIWKGGVVKSPTTQIPAPQEHAP